MTEVDAASKRAQRISILGVPVDRVSMEETLELVDTYVSGDAPRLIVTADASGIAQAQEDPELLEIYRTADLVTPDSIGVLWAAKRIGQPIASTVSGVDILDRICAASAEKGYRIYFLGGEPGVAELAAERMRLRYPGCQIVGARHGYFKPDQDLTVAREVAASHPDVLVVAMGIPRQEKFIRTTASIIRAKVGIGVGGSFDVFSGRKKRAPVLIQKLRLEWFWRTVLNPKKFHKTKMLPKFFWRVLKSRR